MANSFHLRLSIFTTIWEKIEESLRLKFRIIFLSHVVFDCACRGKPPRGMSFTRWAIIGGYIQGPWRLKCDIRSLFVNEICTYTTGWYFLWITVKKIFFVNMFSDYPSRLTGVKDSNKQIKLILSYHLLFVNMFSYYPTTLTEVEDSNK